MVVKRWNVICVMAERIVNITVLICYRYPKISANTGRCCDVTAPCDRMLTLYTSLGKIGRIIALPPVHTRCSHISPYMTLNPFNTNQYMGQLGQSIWRKSLSHKFPPRCERRIWYGKISGFPPIYDFKCHFHVCFKSCTSGLVQGLKCTHMGVGGNVIWLKIGVRFVESAVNSNRT